MSLRFRLSFLITLLFLLILVVSSILVIENARRSIENEVNSAATLTLQLIDIAFANLAEQPRHDVQETLLSSISSLESSRHLYIDIIQPTNLERKLPFRLELPIVSNAPSWFIRLVKPEPIEYRRLISQGSLPVTEIVIKANPSDEITEVWQETKNILLMLIVFMVLSIVLVYYTLGRGLAPIDTILKGLDGIEQGNYRLRLPVFNLPELSRISEKFNLMAGVLQKSRDENRTLTQKSLAIQEQERRRLAQELHDELGQSITAIKAVAASIEQQGEKHESLESRTHAIIDVSNHMYSVARNMMRRLRPAILDELGLLKALQDMIDDWNSHHEDVFCHFDFKGDLSDLGEAININIYRIVQESLTNIIKHAQATEVDIQLEKTIPNKSEAEEQGAQLTLSIKDNGVGFNQVTTRMGLGIMGMRERVEVLHGEFKLLASPGHGVTIHITIPVNTDGKDDE